MSLKAVAGRDYADGAMSFGGFASDIAGRLDVNAVKQATAIIFTLGVGSHRSFYG
jgi:hypothetical protein